MQIRSTLKKRCSRCRFVKRRGYLYVVCSSKPRHKQKQA